MEGHSLGNVSLLGIFYGGGALALADRIPALDPSERQHTRTSIGSHDLGPVFPVRNGCATDVHIRATYPARGHSFVFLWQLRKPGARTPMC